MRAEIMEYYRTGVETTRLLTGHGRLEFLRTWDVLTRVLPPAPAAVLDVGGATGVYAAPLTAAGYRVHVVDPVPEHVGAAAELAGVTASVGDARALTEADASHDAVLLLGPLYHLPDRTERVAAWREAARVVRPGGPVIGAAISRYASMHDGFLHGYDRDPRFQEVVRADLAGGVHRVPADREGWFTTAYFHHPAELAAEMRDAGLTAGRVLPVEGAFWLLGGVGEILDDAGRTAVLLEMLRGVEEEPTLLGSSAHLLAIGQRPQ
jgi:SAM-dependent methyltransferase